MPTALFFRYAVGGLVSLRTLQPTVHRCLASTKVRGHVLDLDAGIEHLLRFSNAFLFCGSLACAALYLAAALLGLEALQLRHFAKYVHVPLDGEHEATGNRVAKHVASVVSVMASRHSIAKPLSLVLNKLPHCWRKRPPSKLCIARQRFQLLLDLRIVGKQGSFNRTGKNLLAKLSVVACPSRCSRMGFLCFAHCTALASVSLAATISAALRAADMSALA